MSIFSLIYSLYFDYILEIISSQIAMLFFGKYLLSLILFHSIIGSFEIILHLTDWIKEMETFAELEHDCIYVSALQQHYTNTYQILSYYLIH
jgi:hypothetical protein